MNHHGEIRVIAPTSRPQSTNEEPYLAKPLPGLPVEVRSISQDSSTSQEPPQPQHPEKPNSDKKDGAFKRLLRIAKKLWLFEALSALTSISLLATLVILFIEADGHTQKQYAFGELTLNGLVALLTTAMQTSMMVCVTAALSQQKWTRFTKRSQRLHDIEIFDEASRGPWGSGLLLLLRPGV